MLRAGVGFAAVMKLLGHTSPAKTLRYVDVTLTDPQREFQLARSKPRHLAPQPKTRASRLRAGLQGLIDSLLATQPHGDRRSFPARQRTAHHPQSTNRLANRLTRILNETRKLQTT
jgi:hypothetical protein